ncbi:hypothetical protein LSTR_LSTR016515 [Laodelphax striatellus]|uniref:Uncharacterized protein n=1 Tax=Laodelphax striatellus TaxID=195883 RepID=A0A482XKL2_LAOST|nr:hypothetical protein LSTR_LSTR016515 [Laodelphax striatellus]
MQRGQEEVVDETEIFYYEDRNTGGVCWTIEEAEEQQKKITFGPSVSNTTTMKPIAEKLMHSWKTLFQLVSVTLHPLLVVDIVDPLIVWVNDRKPTTSLEVSQVKSIQQLIILIERSVERTYHGTQSLLALANNNPDPDCP